MFALLFGFSLLTFYIFLIMPLISVVSFTFYGLDKWRARRGEERIPEATLHLWDACGGWPGGFVAQRLFRHKTIKRSFQVLYWATVILNVASIYVVYRAFYG